MEQVRIRKQDVPSEELLVSFGAFVDPQLVLVEGHDLGTSVLPMVADLQVYLVPTATKNVWSVTYTAKKMVSDYSQQLMPHRRFHVLNGGTNRPLHNSSSWRQLQEG